MAKKKKQLSPKYQVWIDARRGFHLSHTHIQMARELGMNPKRFRGKANCRQEPWKLPLPQFVEKLYFKRFMILDICSCLNEGILSISQQ